MASGVFTVECVETAKRYRNAANIITNEYVVGVMAVQMRQTTHRNDNEQIMHSGWHERFIARLTLARTQQRTILNHKSNNIIRTRSSCYTNIKMHITQMSAHKFTEHDSRPFRLGHHVPLTAHLINGERWAVGAYTPTIRAKNCGRNNQIVAQRHHNDTIDMAEHFVYIHCWIW